MKKFTYTIIAMFALLFGTALNAKAEDLSEFEGRVKATDWAQYAVTIDELKDTETEFYICMDNGTSEKHNYRFIDAGGAYGSEAVLDTRGIRFKATTSGNYYLLDAAVNNNINNDNSSETYFGTYSWGTKTYFDILNKTNNDVNNYAQWSMTAVTSSDKTGYYLKNVGKNQYVSYPTDLKNAVMSSTSSVWYLVPVDKFHKVATSWDGDGNTLVELSGLVYNSHFTRNATSKAWEFYTFSQDGDGDKIAPSDEGSYDAAVSGYNAYLSIHPTLGTKVSGAGFGNNYVNFKGCYGAAEIHKSIIMRQKISNIPAGTYIVTAQAFFYDPDNTASSDAYFFAANTTTGNEKRTNGVSIKALSSTEYTDFNKLVTLHKGYLKDTEGLNDSQISTYFRYNVPAAEFMAQYKNESTTDYDEYIKTFANETDYYELDEDYKRISVEVTVTEGGTLTIGFAKTSDTGYAFLDNVKLYYTGNYEFGIDAYNTTKTALADGETVGVDEKIYPNERRFNLSRDFGMDYGKDDEESASKATWEPIVLPVDLSGSEIKNAFGDKAKLAKLKGVEGTTIVFDDVDLSDDTKVALEAGECYVIKVTKAPTVAKGDTYTFYRCSSDKTNNIEQTYYGPVYHIAGVNRNYETSDDNNKNLAGLLTSQGYTFTSGEGKVTKDYRTSDGTLHFSGFFYDTYNEGGAPAESYIVTKGKMYYLSSTWNGIVGTSWYLTYDAPASKAKPRTMTMSIGNDGNTSNIISAITPEGITPANGSVYNLNGQKVSSAASLKGLVKGVYIMNGRKYVVK